MVDALDLGAPVVISPSLSGMYSLPFLTAPGSQVRGYVPVAPICTDKINAANYASVKVPMRESLTCPFLAPFLIWGLGSRWMAFRGAELPNATLLV